MYKILLFIPPNSFKNCWGSATCVTITGQWRSFWPYDTSTMPQHMANNVTRHQMIPQLMDQTIRLQPIKLSTINLLPKGIVAHHIIVFLHQMLQSLSTRYSTKCCTHWQHDYSTISEHWISSISTFIWFYQTSPSYSRTNKSFLNNIRPASRLKVFKTSIILTQVSVIQSIFFGMFPSRIMILVCLILHIPLRHLD